VVEELWDWWGEQMPETIKSYQDLRVWQDAVTLAEICYRATSKFPREEIFGLTSQIRRASTSVPANIAEGYGRESRPSFVHSLRIAQGSLKELETHLLVSQRVGFKGSEEVDTALERCTSLGKMLRTLIRTLQRKAGN
jgi:four helix bundle protein